MILSSEGRRRQPRAVSICLGGGKTTHGRLPQTGGLSTSGLRSGHSLQVVECAGQPKLEEAASVCVASKLRPCHIEPGLVPTDTVVPADGEVLGWSKPETMQLLASPLRRSFARPVHLAPPSCIRVRFSVAWVLQETPSSAKSPKKMLLRLALPHSY